MNFNSFFLLTWKENIKAQLTWIAMGIMILSLLLAAYLSGSALSAQKRILETSTYFLVEIVLVFVAVFTGATGFNKDYSNRGIAEILIPNGLSRSKLFLYRFLSQSLFLFFLSFSCYLSRYLAIGIFGFGFSEWQSNLFMLVFSSLKSVLAGAIAWFLAVISRPVLALIGSLTLLGLGSVSGNLAAVGLQNQISGQELITPEMRILLKFFRIWNPNFLTLNSFSAEWERPELMDFLFRTGWGICAIGFFVTLAISFVRFKDIEGFRVS